MADTPARAEEAVGLPQLEFSTFTNQIFWLVVALVAIYLILTKVALPRIGGVIADRQGSITNDIAQAEELKKKAEEAEAAYEKALADARAEAQKIAGQTKAEMQAQLDEEIAKADAQIAEETAKSEARIAEVQAGAVQAVRQVSQEAAAEIVKALGSSADASAIEAAIDARMKG
ncbi:MAG: F0F1 ATP synthase subunit B' [Pseudomonadota bacterium]